MKRLLRNWRKVSYSEFYFSNITYYFITLLPYKDNKEKEIKICKFHSDGYCKKGVNCDFIHQEKPQPQNSSYLRNEYQSRTNPMFGNNKSSNSNPFDNFFGSSNASNNNNQKRNNTNADTEGCKNQ